jgi:AcrR family transcriptional regulator
MRVSLPISVECILPVTDTAAAPMPEPSTAERILDAAEDLFAAKGYSATSLGDVADRVGIRSPSLYNHFRNKEALYLAVLERLLTHFTAPLQELQGQPITQARIEQWLETIVRLHHARPNLARLLQHAALSGGPHTNELIERLFSPMFAATPASAQDQITILGDPELQPWAVMALNNMVMSYITMAPMYRDLLGQDPFSEEALEKQLNLILTLLRAVLEYAAR